VICRLKKVVKELKMNAVLGYRNDSNPFSDPNLIEKYVNSFSLFMKLGNKISVVDYQEQRENQRRVLLIILSLIIIFHLSSIKWYS
jgi:hypothetical protein